MANRILRRAVAGVIASTIGTTVYIVSCDGNPIHHGTKDYTLNDAIKKTEELCKRVKEESGSPGLVAGVSVDGINVLNLGAQLRFSFYLKIMNHNRRKFL